MIRHLLHPQGSNNHRAKILHPEWNIILSVVAVISVVILTLVSRVYVQTGGIILGYATNITADQVVSQTNAERAQTGLTALTMNEMLNKAAHAKANDMFANQYWAHVSPDGKQPWDFIHESGYSYASAGENLARDFYDTTGMVQAWMDSPTHKANIVNQRYTQIGVAVVNGTLNGTETTLVVQMFGSPLAIDPSRALAERGAQVTVGQQVPVDPNNNLVDSPRTGFVEQPSTDETTPVPLQRSTTIVQGIGRAPAANQPGNQVLAAFSIFAGSIRPWPSISMLQFVKALSVVLVATVGSVLLYDWTLLSMNPRSRLVGHNLAHIIFLLTVATLVIAFHSGLIQ